MGASLVVPNSTIPISRARALRLYHMGRKPLMLAIRVDETLNVINRSVGID